MPDGDYFERKLRGKGWRKVYRLGCSLAPTDAVVDKIMGAVAHIFRTESTDGVRQIYTHLQSAIDNPLRQLYPQQVYDGLISDIQAAAVIDGYSELCRVAECAALQTFNELDKSIQSPSEDVIKQQFTGNLVWKLTERRCLGPVRDGIMQGSGRNKGAQLSWEIELRNRILKPSASLSKSLLAEDSNSFVRAPKRLYKPMPMTLDTLYQPLQTSGESR